MKGVPWGLVVLVVAVGALLAYFAWQASSAAARAASTVDRATDAASDVWHDAGAAWDAAWDDVGSWWDKLWGAEPDPLSSGDTTETYQAPATWYDEHGTYPSDPYAVPDPNDDSWFYDRDGNVFYYND